MTLVAETREVLLRIAAEFGTPCYVYVLDGVHRTLAELDRYFGGRFSISFAVKSNPNLAFLRRIASRVSALDVSSIGELERALMIGYEPALLSFSGPAKRIPELQRALEAGCGEFVCESDWELGELDRLAGDRGLRAVFSR